MVGNVWEWTRSLWGTYGGKPDFVYPYTQRTAEREDLTASNEVWRVVRGGSWYRSSQLVRAACRYGNLPLNRYHSAGIRVVCAPGLPPR